MRNLYYEHLFLQNTSGDFPCKNGEREGERERKRETETEAEGETERQGQRETEREQNLAKQFTLHLAETYSEPFPTSKPGGYLIGGNYFHKKYPC